MLDLLRATHELFGDCSQESGDETIYIGGVPLTDEQLAQVTEKASQNELEYVSLQYQRDREYPTIEDQLDDLYHNGYDGWKDTITAIKIKHPK